MALPALKTRLGEGGFVLSAWLGLPDPLVHEAFLRADFDAVAFDLQHGLIDTDTLRQGIERAAFLGKPALVRLPIGDRALAARALDFGASGVVMPMIETPEDASALVDAVKYPPQGQRSFGPFRAAPLHGYDSGPAYVTEARGETLALAMIETASALSALDDILAIEGLDGVFVGPSDLSIALSEDGSLDRQGAPVVEAIGRVAAAAAKAGKIAAIYGVTAQDARRYRDAGYRLVCVGSDIAVVGAGAADLANAVRGGGTPA